MPQLTKSAHQITNNEQPSNKNQCKECSTTAPKTRSDKDIRRKQQRLAMCEWVQGWTLLLFQWKLELLVDLLATAVHLPSNFCLGCNLCILLAYKDPRMSEYGQLSRPSPPYMYVYCTFCVLSSGQKQPTTPLIVSYLRCCPDYASYAMESICMPE